MNRDMQLDWNEDRIRHAYAKRIQRPEDAFLIEDCPRPVADRVEALSSRMGSAIVVFTLKSELQAWVTAKHLVVPRGEELQMVAMNSCEDVRIAGGGKGKSKEEMRWLHLVSQGEPLVVEFEQANTASFAWRILTMLAAIDPPAR